jgi:hypothetical protein
MKYTIEMTSHDMIYVHTKFHEDRYRHLSKITVITQTI